MRTLTWAYALRLSSLFPLPDPRSGGVLAPEPSRAEHFPATGKLLFLRLVGLALPCTHDRQHHDGFSDRPENHAQPYGLEPQEVVYLLTHVEFWDSRGLQVF